MNQRQRLPSDVPDKHGKHAEEKQSYRHQKQDRRDQERLVDVLLPEEPSRYQLAAGLKLPVQDSGDREEHEVHVVLLNERKRRGAGGAQSLHDQARPGAHHPRDHEDRQAQKARDGSGDKRRPAHMDRKRVSIGDVCEVWEQSGQPDQW